MDFTHRLCRLVCIVSIGSHFANEGDAGGCGSDVRKFDTPGGECGVLEAVHLLKNVLEGWVDVTLQHAKCFMATNFCDLKNA